MLNSDFYDSSLNLTVGQKMFWYGDDVWKVSPLIPECQETLNRFMEDWDSGLSYHWYSTHPLDSSFLFGKAVKRDADTEEEIDACADMLHGALQQDIRRYWIRTVKREYVTALCNLMYQTIADGDDDIPYFYYRFGADYTIISGVTVNSATPELLVEEWNNAHPDEAPIRFEYRRNSD